MTPTALMDAARGQRLVEAFVTLVGDDDEHRLLGLLARHCVALTVAEAAVVLLDHDSGTRIAFTTDDRLAQPELLAVADGAASSRSPIRAQRPSPETVPDRVRERWPEYVAGGDATWSWVRAVPLGTAAVRLGALVLAASESLPDHELDIATGLADVTSATIHRQRAAGAAERLAGQLQHALDSRVLIEQAKGRVAERTGRTPTEAFEALRTYARSHRLGLRQVAKAIVDDDRAFFRSVPGPGTRAHSPTPRRERR